MDHTINHFEFTEISERLTHGKYLKSTNSLDGYHSEMRIDQDMDYYLKIVDTEYEYWYNKKKLN